MSDKKYLAPLDLAFFVLESRERTSNVGPLAILKPPAGTRKPGAFADRLLASMRKCPVGAPFNMRYVAPSLQGLPHLETVDVDMKAHSFRLTLPAPGTDAQLFETVCRIHEEMFDRSRPPWACYVIDGLEGGRVALYAKVHHGLVDGKGMVELCTRWFSQDPQDTTVHALWEGLPQARRKTAVPLDAMDTAKALTQKALAAAKVMSSLYAALLRQAASSAGLKRGLPLPFLKTPKALRSQPSVQRSFSYCVLQVAELKAFGKAHGASLNDVLLTVLDMAINRYLTESGHAITRHPLVADMPVALPKQPGGGNAIAVLQFSLGATLASPLRRLQQIMKRTEEVKSYVRKTNPSALMAYTAAVHGVPALLEMAGIHKAPMLANMVISNPFGLPHKCYLARAEVEMALPISVLVHGQTLNITAVTYDKGLQIAFLGLEADMPDIQLLADYTEQAMQELKSSPARGRRAATETAAG